MLYKKTQEDLIKDNLENLKTNNYTIEEILKDADFWFNDLVINIGPSSRGWKIACKKLAEEVRSLRKQVHKK